MTEVGFLHFQMISGVPRFVNCWWLEDFMSLSDRRLRNVQFPTKLSVLLPLKHVSSLILGFLLIAEIVVLNSMMFLKYSNFLRFNLQFGNSNLQLFDLFNFKRCISPFFWIFDETVDFSSTFTSRLPNLQFFLSLYLSGLASAKWWIRPEPSEQLLSFLSLLRP